MSGASLVMCNGIACSTNTLSNFPESGVGLAGQPQKLQEEKSVTIRKTPHPCSFAARSPREVSFAAHHRSSGDVL